jgi:thiol-disulfide isomerase/thioredoxin
MSEGSGEVKLRSTSAVVLIALSGVLACAQAQELPPGILATDARPAPALELPDTDGRTYELAASRGRWVFVHFWASWCGPCRYEMPAIQRMSRAIEGLPLAVILVNTAEEDDAVFSFLAVAAPDLDSLMDYDGVVTERWRPRGLPASFIVDPAGTIRYQALGGRPWDEPAYVDFLRRLVAGGEQPAAH